MTGSSRLPTLPLGHQHTPCLQSSNGSPCLAYSAKDLDARALQALAGCALWIRLKEPDRAPAQVPAERMLSMSVWAHALSYSLLTSVKNTGRAPARSLVLASPYLPVHHLRQQVGRFSITALCLSCKIVVYFWLTIEQPRASALQLSPRHDRAADGARSITILSSKPARRQALARRSLSWASSSRR